MPSVGAELLQIHRPGSKQLQLHKSLHFHAYSRDKTYGMNI